MSVNQSDSTVGAPYLIDAEVVKSKTEANGGSGRVRPLGLLRRTRSEYSAPTGIKQLCGAMMDPAAMRPAMQTAGCH